MLGIAPKPGLLDAAKVLDVVRGLREQVNVLDVLEADRGATT